MCQQTIVISDGRRLTGRLVSHLEGARAEIDCDGRRYVGTKLEQYRPGPRR